MLLCLVLLLVNIALAFSLNNIVFLGSFLSIILILSFLLLLFNYVFVTLFLLIAYTSIILVLFLVNGLLTMHSLSFKLRSSLNFKLKLLINYSLPLCSYNIIYTPYTYSSYSFAFKYAPFNSYSSLSFNSYSSLFLFLYVLTLLSYFDFLMIYVSNFNLFVTKMNALGSGIYSSSLSLIVFSMLLIILTSINILFIV